MKRISILLALVVLSAPLYAADGFRLVANASVPVSTLSRSAASAVFLKKTPRWSDGTPVVPVDQSETSPARALLTTAVHGKSVAAIKSYWQQQIFSGREVPPVEKTSDAEVLSYVRSTPGAIGYISKETPVTGAKVVEIE